MNRRKFRKSLISLTALINIPGINILFPKREKRIHIIGLGDAGCNIVEYVFLKGLEAKYTYIATLDRKKYLKGINLVSFNRPKDYRDRKDWYKDKNVLTKEIKSIFQKDNYYILVAGLKGYTGSLLIRDLYNYLNDQSKIFTAIASYPFRYEGKQSINFAKNIVKDIVDKPNFKTFSLEIIREKYGNLGGREALNKADDYFYKQILHEINYSFTHLKIDTKMKSLTENLKQLNEIISEQSIAFDEKVLERILRDMNANHKIKYSYTNLSAYYELQVEKAIFNKSKSMLLNDFDTAVECRNIEKGYYEKMKILHESNIEDSRFVMEGNYVVFCYHKQDKRDKQIMEILSELM